jgi:predicted heme/steroid binding protein
MMLYISKIYFKNDVNSLVFNDLSNIQGESHMRIKKAFLVVALVLVIGLTACSAKPAPGTKTFTITELAQYDGLNGHKAYVAVDGKVYDVTNSSAWSGGKHQGMVAGVDLSTSIGSAPHGKSVLSSLTVVGTLTN